MRHVLGRFVGRLEEPRPGYSQSQDEEGVWFQAGCPQGGRLTWLGPDVKDYYCIDAPANLTLVLSNEGGSGGGGHLAELEPTGEEDHLRARAFCDAEEVSTAIRLEAKVEDGSGGHSHGDEPVRRPRGTLVGNDRIGETITVPAGSQFSYRAPAVSGDHTIEATCVDTSLSCKQEGPDQVWVGMKNLVPLAAFSEYELIGDTDSHPDNHYLTGEALNRVVVLAALYRGQLKQLFPEPEFDFKLHLNDASLERGGIFDISNTWTRPHAEHCMGTAIDIRANDAPGAIPNWYREKFEELARVVGADPGELEIPRDSSGRRTPDLRHYHVRLMGQEGIQCP